MEDNRKRRQNDPMQYSASDPRYSQDHGQARGFSNTPADRYRGSATTTASSSVGRNIAGSASGYGYYADPAPTFPTALPASSMQYTTDYGSDQRQQPSFGSYNPGMMFGVGQSPQGSVFDATQQFQQRQPAGMQMLSDVAAPYYTGEPSNSSGPSLMQHQTSPSSATAFQQSPTDRTTLLQGYPGGMAQMTSMTQGPAEPMEEEDYAGSGLDEAYNTYQNALKEIFQNIRNGILVDASQSLVDVSDWLLSHVGELGEPPFTARINKDPLTVYNKGLTADDEALHGDRVKMWNEFNTAWLAVLQKQKDLTLDYVNSGNLPRQPQSLIPYEFLKKMAKELIRLCDNIEKHGLVDYQYGVAEERIIASKLGSVQALSLQLNVCSSRGVC
jgi:hypothetical protein